MHELEHQKAAWFVVYDIAGNGAICNDKDDRAFIFSDKEEAQKVVDRFKKMFPTIRVIAISGGIRVDREAVKMEQLKQ